jgi:hypothetical protein
MVATLSILSAALAAASVFSGFASAQVTTFFFNSLFFAKTIYSKQQSRVRIIFSGGEIAQFGPRGQCVRRSYVIPLLQFIRSGTSLYRPNHFRKLYLFDPSSTRSQYITSLDISQHVDCVFYRFVSCIL